MPSKAPESHVCRSSQSQLMFLLAVLKLCWSRISNLLSHGMRSQCPSQQNCSSITYNCDTCGDDARWSSQHRSEHQPIIWLIIPQWNWSQALHLPISTVCRRRHGDQTASETAALQTSQKDNTGASHTCINLNPQLLHLPLQFYAVQTLINITRIFEITLRLGRLE